MSSIFDRQTDFRQQDRASFSFRHTLADHPSLRLESLIQSIPELESRFVFHSARRMSQDEDFEQAITADRKVASIESVIANIHTSDSYIMVREPERHAAFSGIHQTLVDEITRQISLRGLGREAIQPRFYLFISSPNSITPFHYDRASNFLFQVRGSKEVTVFPPWNPEVITSAEYDAHMAYGEGAVKWKEAAEPLGRTYTCEPGDGVHIPFVAGHHVRNGSKDLSITLSIFFNHRRTWTQLNAMLYNNRMRRLVGPIGLSPFPVGKIHALDAAKSLTYRAYSRLRR